MLLLGQSRLIHKSLEEGDPMTKKGMCQVPHGKKAPVGHGHGCSLLLRCKANPGQVLRVLTDLGQ